MKLLQFSAKSEDGTFAKLTKQAIEMARSKANDIVNHMGRETTDILNIELLNKCTRRKARDNSPFGLEQKASINLVVTFDTNAM